MFSKFDDFASVMDKVRARWRVLGAPPRETRRRRPPVASQVTENYGVLVLDNTKRSNDVQDLITWYRANPHLPDFKIGKPIFWAMYQATAKSEEDIEQVCGPTGKAFLPS